MLKLRAFSFVLVAAMSVGISTAAPPKNVAPYRGETLGSFTVVMVGERLIVAFRSARGVSIVFPIIGGSNQLNGVQDGPDPIPGAKESGMNPPQNTAPASTWVRVP